VPLEQHFIGVRGKVRSETSKRNMDQAVFDKVRMNDRQTRQFITNRI
jgi:antiviral helicase SLH1